MALSLWYRAANITTHKLQQNGLFRIQDALFGHQLAVDGQYGELVEIPAGNQRHVFLHAVGDFGVHSVEEIAAAGFEGGCGMGGAEGGVVVENFRYVWGCCLDCCAEGGEGVDSLILVSFGGDVGGAWKLLLGIRRGERLSGDLLVCASRCRAVHLRT